MMYEVHPDGLLFTDEEKVIVFCAFFKVTMSCFEDPQICMVPNEKFKYVAFQFYLTLCNCYLYHCLIGQVVHNE